MFHHFSAGSRVQAPQVVGSDGLHYWSSPTCQTEDAVSPGLVSDVRPSLGLSFQAPDGYSRSCRTTHLVVSPVQSSCWQTFRPLTPTIQITTNASPTGWGALVLDLTTNGHWMTEERGLHINLLELLAIFKAFWAFKRLLLGHVVQVATDNTTAVFYLNKQDGTCSQRLLYLTVQIWE